MSHLIRWLPLLAFPFVLLAACGDDGPSDEERESNAQTAQQAEQDDSSSLPGEYFEPLGRSHIGPDETYTEYTSDPPTSGPHFGSLAPWAVNDEPIAREQIPHNLEHGGVVILYRCPDGCDEIVEELSSYVEERADDGDDILLAEYAEEMDSRIAVISWTRLLTMDEVDTDAIDEFVGTHLCRFDPEFVCSRADE